MVFGWIFRRSNSVVWRVSGFQSPVRFLGSEQESVTHPHEMGILIFWNSGYTRQDERDGLDQSSGLAGVSGLSSRDQRTGENVEAMGTAEAREPEVGMFRMWAEVERSL